MSTIAAGVNPSLPALSRRGYGSHCRLVPQPQIFGALACDYECEYCGDRFLSHRIHENGVRCSNRCELERCNTMRRKWRKENPPDYRAVNAARMRQRAEARAGRKCEHCSVNINATRSTRRFCSDIVGVRAHHPNALGNHAYQHNGQQDRRDLIFIRWLRLRLPPLMLTRPQIDSYQPRRRAPPRAGGADAAIGTVRLPSSARQRRRPNPRAAGRRANR